MFQEVEMIIALFYSIVIVILWYHASFTFKWSFRWFREITKPVPFCLALSAKLWQVLIRLSTKWKGKVVPVNLKGESNSINYTWFVYAMELVTERNSTVLTFRNVICESEVSYLEPKPRLWHYWSLGVWVYYDYSDAMAKYSNVIFRNDNFSENCQLLCMYIRWIYIHLYHAHYYSYLQQVRNNFIIILPQI